MNVNETIEKLQLLYIESRDEKLKEIIDKINSLPNEERGAVLKILYEELKKYQRKGGIE